MLCHVVFDLFQREQVPKNMLNFFSNGIKKTDPNYLAWNEGRTFLLMMSATMHSNVDAPDDAANDDNGGGGVDNCTIRC